MQYKGKIQHENNIFFWNAVATGKVGAGWPAVLEFLEFLLVLELFLNCKWFLKNL